MKIGVGVITMGIRPLKNYHLASGTEFYTFVDKEKKGPGHGRNKCLKYLSEKGCDHIFLFDDDCYPTMSGWEDYFIQQAVENNVDYMALPEYFKTGLHDYKDSNIQYWDGALGCFIYQNNKAIASIGGYNEEYDRYGFEDSARSYRAIKAGLCGKYLGFPFPIRGIAYIHSEDIFAENPTPNISREDKEEYVKKNVSIYKKELERAERGEFFYPFT